MTAVTIECVQTCNWVIKEATCKHLSVVSHHHVDVTSSSLVHLPHNLSFVCTKWKTAPKFLHCLCTACSENKWLKSACFRVWKIAVQGTTRKSLYHANIGQFKQIAHGPKQKALVGFRLQFGMIWGIHMSKEVCFPAWQMLSCRSSLRIENYCIKVSGNASKPGFAHEVCYCSTQFGRHALDISKLREQQAALKLLLTRKQWTQTSELRCYTP